MKTETKEALKKLALSILSAIGGFMTAILTNGGF